MSIRVFELAKELNTPTKEFIKKINKLGIEASGNFSSLTEEQVTRIKKEFLEPASRIEESVVSSQEGEKRVRRRIISAKKARESKKIRESLNLQDKPLQKDVETRQKMSAQKELEEAERKKREEEKRKEREEKARLEAEAAKAAEEEAAKKREELASQQEKAAAQEIAKEAEEKEKEKEEPKTVARKEKKELPKETEKVEKPTAPAPREKKQKKPAPVVTEKVKAETAKVVEKEEKNVIPETRKAPKPAEKVKVRVRPRVAQPVIRVPKEEIKSETVKTKPKMPKKPVVVKEKKVDEEDVEIKVEVRQKKPLKTASEMVPKVDSKKKHSSKHSTKETKPGRSNGKHSKKADDEWTPKEKVAGKSSFKKKKKGSFGSDEEESEYIKSRRKQRNKRWDKKQRQPEKQPEKHTFNPSKKELVVGESITVGELAALIGIKVPEIIRTLISLDIMATITQSIDGETAQLVASEHGVELKVQFETLEDQLEETPDAEGDLQSRSPVVTIMGHVDHGKTSLLDSIRASDVSKGEAGGITQHIGAYHVDTKSGGSYTFLDTPGHAAFTAMRARGANATDIVVLVVAADDGPRPQTVEAIDHAKEANVPIIVAINKCDKPDANPGATVQKLMAHGLVSEDFGGDIPMIQVSAKAGTGIPDLLETIQLQAEIMELKANPNKLARGVVIESKVDKGRGNTATFLVQNGTLKIGDNFVVGTEYGRVRAMWDDAGKQLTEAIPSIPVEIVGLNGVPRSGDKFNVCEDEKKVRQLAAARSQKEKDKRQAKQRKQSLENLFDSMGKEEKKVLNLIIKTDVIGSLEALSDSLLDLGNDEVEVRVIHGAVGAISSTNVVLAAASNAVIIGFNNRPEPKANQLAKEEGVDIRLYSVIYEAIDDVTAALEGMLQPIVREELQGTAKILEVFNIPKIGTIAGSKVVEGKIVRDCPIRVIRDNVVIHDGHLASLKRFKDNVKDVTEGFECGIGVENYRDLQPGDMLESYLRLETAAKLS